VLVQDFLQSSADKFPRKTALVCDGRRLTYQEIDVSSNQVAHALIAHGIKRGDRVAIHLPNSVEAVISIFGVLKAGAIFVVINPTTKRDKLIYLLNDCKATALFAEARHIKLVTEVSTAVPSLKITVLSGTWAAHASDTSDRFSAFEDLWNSHPSTRPACPTIDQDLACLVYTSGSTGRPKGVMCGHNNVTFASASIIQYLENVPEDIIINVLPLSFDYGLYQLLMAFRIGGTLVLERSFAYPAAMLKRIETERVTGFPGVPTMFSLLLQMDLSVYDLSSLRYITNTAAALPPSHIKDLRERFAGVTLYSMYGLTECKRTLWLPPDQLDTRPGSVGIAIPGTEVWVEDDQGNHLGPGEVGQLMIRGSHVMRGYWEKPEPTAARYRPGPTPGERTLCSGDLFRMDEERYLYFVSRKDDMIKSRGEKVSPKEIEDVLYSIPGVIEAAVVGVPDPVLGQGIKAFVVVDGKVRLTRQDILRHCRANLENFMQPTIVEFRAELPKTNSGKIRKIDLH